MRSCARLEARELCLSRLDQWRADDLAGQPETTDTAHAAAAVLDYGALGLLRL